MKKQFEEICQKVGNPKKCARAFAKLAVQYRTPRRFYHTFYGHISHCTKEAEAIPDRLFSDKCAVVMALFTHDAVMDFRRKDDIELSAKFAIELCRYIEAPDQFSRSVKNLVLATGHSYIPKDEDARLIIDIDLSIFGQGKKVFDRYEKNIRKEYSFVPPEIFRSERARMLKYFLFRPSIFLTGYFQQKYMQQARKNLIRSIAKLER